VIKGKRLTLCRSQILWKTNRVSLAEVAISRSFWTDVCDFGLSSRSHDDQAENQQRDRPFGPRECGWHDFRNWRRLPSRLIELDASKCRLAWGYGSIGERTRDNMQPRSKGLARYGPAVAEAEFGQQPPRGGREGECRVTGIPSSIHVEPRRYHLSIPHSHLFKLCSYSEHLTED
jgi:hypothetical protein